jgi:hypothetical protein
MTWIECTCRSRLQEYRPSRTLLYAGRTSKEPWITRWYYETVLVCTIRVRWHNQNLSSLIKMYFKIYSDHVINSVHPVLQFSNS